MGRGPTSLHYKDIIWCIRGSASPVHLNPFMLMVPPTETYFSFFLFEDDDADMTGNGHFYGIYEHDKPHNDRL